MGVWNEKNWIRKECKEIQNSEVPKRKAEYPPHNNISNKRVNITNETNNFAVYNPSFIDIMKFLENTQNEMKYIINDS